MGERKQRTAITTNVERKHANGKFVNSAHVDHIAQIQPHPIKPYAIPSFYSLEQIQNSHLTLAELLTSSSDPLHQQVALLSKAFLTPDQVREFRQLPQEIQQVVLVIRALDKGMQALSLKEKFAFFFRYTRYESEQSNSFDWYPTSEGSTLADDCRSAILKPETVQIRYQRFIQYIDFLEKIAQDHPNVLISTQHDAPYSGGIFTEYDFWVQEQLRKASASIKTITREELAQETPEEFRQRKSEEEVLLMFLASQADTRYLFRTLAVSGIKTARRNKRREAVAEYFVESETGELTLSIPATHIARRLNVNTATIWEDIQFLANTYRRRGKQVKTPGAGDYHPGPESETIRIAQLIALAVTQLDTHGHRWRYGQYGITQILEHINTKLIPQLEPKDILYNYRQYRIHIREDQIIHIIRNYMNPRTAKKLSPDVARQIPQLANTKPVSVDRAITTDTLELIAALGYPIRETIHRLLQVEPRLTPEVQLLDQIIDTLGLISKKASNKHAARGNTRMRLRKLLRKALAELNTTIPQS